MNDVVVLVKNGAWAGNGNPYPTPCAPENRGLFYAPTPETRYEG